MFNDSPHTTLVSRGEWAFTLPPLACAACRRCLIPTALPHPPWRKAAFRAMLGRIFPRTCSTWFGVIEQL